jgi:hypothetical protein
LRKWAGLAAKGNPTALHFLFSPNYSSKPKPWEGILKSREVFLSRQAALQFRGFAEAQLHGYDIKAAMHALHWLGTM